MLQVTAFDGPGANQPPPYSPPYGPQGKSDFHTLASCRIAVPYKRSRTLYSVFSLICVLFVSNEADRIEHQPLARRLK